MHVHDLAALDRAVQAAHTALEQGARAGASAEEILAAHRPVSGKTTHDALRAFPEGRDRPLALALARHVAFLTVQRVAGAAAHEAALARRARNTRGADIPGAKGPALVSLEDAIHQALATRVAELCDAWLDVAERAARPVIALERAQREIEIEARSRLGERDEDRTARAALSSSAFAFLERTQDLARSHVRHAARREPNAGAMLEVALARGAKEGWPRTPSLGAIVELVGPTARSAAGALASRVTPPRAELLGASSWARAFAHVGFEMHARARSTVPYALRLGPERLGAHRTALLVASALATPAFHERALGCGKGVARDQARVVALSALLSARAAAVTIAALEPRHAEELLFFGARTGALGAVLPRARPDGEARWSAWLALAGDLAAIEDRHDEDYFRNPRFWSEIAVRAGSAEHPIEGDPSALAQELAAGFERRIA